LVVLVILSGQMNKKILIFNKFILNTENRFRIFGRNVAISLAEDYK
jgi:hypothetical protein